MLVIADHLTTHAADAVVRSACLSSASSKVDASTILGLSIVIWDRCAA